MIIYIIIIMLYYFIVGRITGNHCVNSIFPNDNVPATIWSEPFIPYSIYNITYTQ